jgi:hypothetical protein
MTTAGKKTNLMPPTPTGPLAATQYVLSSLKNFTPPVMDEKQAIFEYSSKQTAKILEYFS